MCDYYSHDLIQWFHLMSSKVHGRSQILCVSQHKWEKLLEQVSVPVKRTKLFPFCGMRWSWDLAGMKNGENRAFSHLSSAIASEKATEDIRGSTETFKLRRKLWDPPLCCLSFTVNVQMHIFSGKRGWFRRRGYTFISIPRHSHNVIHTHTHTRTQKD